MPSSVVQSVLFSTKIWDKEGAKKWLKKHGYKHNDVRKTEDHYRFRQIPPMRTGRYITYPLGRGIEFIIFYY